MKGFGDFKRIAVICVPSEDELKRRNDLKIAEDGIELVNESTLNKMKGNYLNLLFSFFLKMSH